MPNHPNHTRARSNPSRHPPTADQTAKPFTPPPSVPQVWLYRNQASREVIMAFRGTEQVKWKDIVTDLNLTPCSLNAERLDENSGLPFAARLIKAMVPTSDVMVHQGFLTAYDSVRYQAVSLLDSITSSGGKWKVYVTGHSLGGALATLAAFELASRQGPARARQEVAMYSYGSPRAGNKAFASLYNLAVHNSWRVTNSNDIVPSVPRLMGYCHVKHAVRVGGTVGVLVEAETQDVFGEGRGGMDVIQEYAAQVQQQERRWDEVYEEIKAKELDLLNTLMDGTALEEHMETFYLATLRQAVLAVLSKGAGKS